MTIDYRGYGKSTGSPSEAGLISDGVAVVDWALNIAKIPPERIILLGQSLGTAVATAVTEHFVIERKIEFKALILIAAFSDIPTLMSTYAIGGFIPILSPLHSSLRGFFAKHIQETWFSANRLANLARQSKNVNVHLIHSKDDSHIPWTHSNTLFHAAANATSEKGLTAQQIDKAKFHQDLGDSGHVNQWISVANDGGRKTTRQDIVHHGGKSSLTWKSWRKLT